MSRIGNRPISIPTGVEVTIDGNFVKVKGQKGELSRTIHPSMSLKKEGDVLTVVPVEQLRNFYGLTRSLVNNMVVWAEAMQKGETAKRARHKGNVE